MLRSRISAANIGSNLWHHDLALMDWSSTLHSESRTGICDNIANRMISGEGFTYRKAIDLHIPKS